MKKGKLDQITLDIEFLLISVIQGVALATLAANAAEPIGNLTFEYWMYIASSFILILNFWSQAIVHALSFIDWPLDLSHNFLYFLASFIEVMAFSHMTDPMKWFGFMLLFFLVATILYAIDLSLIKNRKNSLAHSPHAMKLYGHILKREKFEFSTLIPLAIVYHVVAFLLILKLPRFFIEQKYHLYLIGGQLGFGIFSLFDSMRNFRTRIKLIG